MEVRSRRLGRGGQVEAQRSAMLTACRHWVEYAESARACDILIKKDDRR